MQSAEGGTTEQLEASQPAVPDLHLYLAASVCQNEQELFPNMSRTDRRSSPEIRRGRVNALTSLEPLYYLNSAFIRSIPIKHYTSINP